MEMEKMEHYLWDFSFDELFHEEGGFEVIEQAGTEEKEALELLCNHFERTAAKCRLIVNSVSKENFSNLLPKLTRQDMILQLCLIYGLSVNETLLTPIQMLETIDNEIYQYFSEYRVFGKRFEFERYSIMNQIALV